MNVMYKAFEIKEFLKEAQDLENKNIIFSSLKKYYSLLWKILHSKISKNTAEIYHVCLNKTEFLCKKLLKTTENNAERSEIGRIKKALSYYVYTDINYRY